MQRGLAQLQRDDFVSKTKKKAQAVLKEKQPALMVLINKPAPTIQQTQIATPAQPTREMLNSKPLSLLSVQSQNSKTAGMDRNTKEAEDKAEQKDHVIDAGAVKMLGQPGHFRSEFLNNPCSN